MNFTGVRKCENWPRFSTPVALEHLGHLDREQLNFVMTQSFRCFSLIFTEYGQNGDKPKRRKSKRRHQNGDNPKRRQARGNINETATKTCGQNGDKGQQNAYRKFTLSSTWQHDSG